MAVADQFLRIAVRAAPDVDYSDVDDSDIDYSSVARYR
jgi:hypothetical protein